MVSIHSPTSYYSARHTESPEPERCRRSPLRRGSSALVQDPRTLTCKCSATSCLSTSCMWVLAASVGMTTSWLLVTDQMIGPDDLTKDKTKGGRPANHMWLDWLACETVETKSTLVGIDQSVRTLARLARTRDSRDKQYIGTEVGSLKLRLRVQLNR